MTQQRCFAGVLFDLDGTLLDTAPDLLAALDRAMRQHGFPPVDKARIKPFISYGAAAMVRASLNGAYNDSLHTRILQTMLDHYQANIAEHTRLFHGMNEVLDMLESKGIIWGVVTNKRKRFTDPLMNALKLAKRAACIVSGDTANNSKPHPEPMLLACRHAGIDPKRCLYIGDSAHDIEAGKSAGMTTLAAIYGYLKPDDDPCGWGADGLIQEPLEILPWLN
jgi:phosphoglycolate phosphatase